jgi:hypothetical protein
MSPHICTCIPRYLISRSIEQNDDVDNTFEDILVLNFPFMPTQSLLIQIEAILLRFRLAHKSKQCFVFAALKVWLGSGEMRITTGL